MLRGDEIRELFVSLVVNLPDEQLGQAARGLPDNVLGSMMRRAIDNTYHVDVAEMTGTVRRPRRARKAQEAPDDVAEIDKATAVDKTEQAVIDAVTAAGEDGIAPREIQAQLGLEGWRLRKVVSGLIDRGAIDRTGRTHSVRLRAA